MNILIRNYDKEVSPAVVSAIIAVFVEDKYDRLKPDEPHSIPYNEKLGCGYTITKQGNGNLCLEFSSKKD